MNEPDLGKYLCVFVGGLLLGRVSVVVFVVVVVAATFARYLT